MGLWVMKKWVMKRQSFQDLHIIFIVIESVSIRIFYNSQENNGDLKLYSYCCNWFLITKQWLNWMKFWFWMEMEWPFSYTEPIALLKYQLVFSWSLNDVCFKENLTKQTNNALNSVNKFLGKSVGAP